MRPSPGRSSCRATTATWRFGSLRLLRWCTEAAAIGQKRQRFRFVFAFVHDRDADGRRQRPGFVFRQASGGYQKRDDTSVLIRDILSMSSHFLSKTVRGAPEDRRGRELA